ncbi:MAG: hypothetical protein M0Z46_21885 [Actinomycetota bacterium]|jgi:hypothetical protein|nr:hypothetical protein [Actinomycetota bacterium]
MTESPENPGRVDAVLAGPAGRRLVAELIGLRFVDLLDALELPYPPNIAGFTDVSSGRSGRRPRSVLGRRVAIDPLHRGRRSAEAAASTHRAALAGVEPDDVRDAVRRIVHDPDGRRRVDVGDSMAVLEALRHVIRGYGFWGNERDEDRLLVAAADELRPVADALVASPATEWWWDDVVRGDQRFAVRATDGGTGPPRGDQVSEQVKTSTERLLAEEARARARHRSPSDVPQNASGDWWSIPIPGFWTSRAVSPVPALHLVCAEETADERVVVWSLGIVWGARILEIRAPADWARLVEIAPVEVTVSRLGDWRTWTGHEGPFYLPDWRVVAEHFDGVHMTVGGYLATRSVAVPVADGYSVLAGWDPDATLWLRDVIETLERVGEWDGPCSFDAEEQG